MPTRARSAASRLPAALLLAALALAACTVPEDEPRRSPSPEVSPTPPGGTPSPDPDRPPTVWVHGRTQGPVTERGLTVVEDSGAPVRLVRLARGATRFLEATGETAGEAWTAIPARRVGDIRPGTEVCAEAVLDAGRYLALQVFVGAACGPSPPDVV